MNAGKRPEHCKGCTSFHNAGRRNPAADLARYNAWCCAKGQEAHKSVAYCKVHLLKRPASPSTGEPT